MQRKNSAKRTKKTQGVGREEVVNVETKQAGITDVHEVVIFRNKVLHRMLYVLPWVSIAACLFSLYRSTRFDFTRLRPTNVNYYAGFLLASISFFLFQILTKKIPQVFASIKKRNIIGSLDDKSASVFRKKYQEFLLAFEDSLNHLLQWLVGGILAVVVIVWQEGIIRGDAFRFHYFLVDVKLGLYSLTMDLIRFLMTFMVGILLWRILVIGIYIWRLGRTFKINPQLGHPDSCGGMESIGNLCLWIVLLISIPAINLIGWILPAQLWSELTENSWIIESMDYGEFYPVLLFLLVILSIMSFFVPLWSIHKSMLQGRTQVKKEMDDLAQSIAEIEKTLLDQAKTLDQNKVDELQKRLKTMQEIYERNKNYPTWPFNVKGLVKFFSVQLLPLLVSLKLTEPIVNWLVSLVTKKGN